VVTFAAAAAEDGTMWWLWMVGGLVVWVVASLLVGMVIGGTIRLADRQSPDRPTTRSTADLPSGSTAVPSVASTTSKVRRRAVPLPPVGIAMAAVAVLLETTGYVLRLSGGGGAAASLLSMDDPYSLPRMFVAFLFAAAAAAAVAGAGSLPGRRTWWLAVGAVAGGIASVKAGSTIHSDALHALNDAIGRPGALLASASAAAAVVMALWFLSRTERRDRRRVLGVLALYAAASVGLSAVSSAVTAATGGASTWAATATFLEESGEALAGVAFLVAVLVGVAPRLVLPAEWVLRRAADAQTLDVPGQLPTRLVSEGSAGR
jgi:hypothetical protein